MKFDIRRGGLVNSFAVFLIPPAIAGIGIDPFAEALGLTNETRTLILRAGWLFGAVGAFFFTLFVMKYMWRQSFADRCMYVFLLALFVGLAFVTILIHASS